MFLCISLFCLVLTEPKLVADIHRVAVDGLERDTIAKLSALKEDELNRLGTVSVAKADPREERPILGTWGVAATLAFHPRVPFERGVKYHVKFDGVVDATFELPEDAKEPGNVVEVFPKADRLPANVLRFYVHFDQPMKEGQGYKQFKMLDADGGEVKHAFLELDEELWDPESRRLTLLLDPGRVKNELLPRVEQGPVLEANRKYTLVVGKEILTAKGQPLGKEFRKAFTTMADDMNGLDPKAWKLAAPASGGKDKLSLSFDKPLDSALIERVISVEDAAGKRVVGGHAKPTDETAWNWQPTEPWKPGDYVIVVKDVLEDVCGNRIGAAFDSAIGEIGARKEKAPTRLPFTVK